jgi:hypothetical protein
MREATVVVGEMSHNKELKEEIILITKILQN